MIYFAYKFNKQSKAKSCQNYEKKFENLTIEYLQTFILGHSSTIQKLQGCADVYMLVIYPAKGSPEIHTDFLPPVA